jgi:hypothetical protein
MVGAPVVLGLLAKVTMAVLGLIVGLPLVVVVVVLLLLGEMLVAQQRVTGALVPKVL